MTRWRASVLAIFLQGFPGGVSAQVNCETIPHGPARTDCYLGLSQFHRAQSDLTMALLRPFASYPDLFDQVQAEQLVLAERVDAGQITPAQAISDQAQLISQLTAEEQRRNLANRAVSAQETAAAAQQSAAVTAAMQGFQPRQVSVDMTVRRGY